MQPAHRARGSTRIVVLHEVDVDAGFGEGFAVPGFDEIAAGVVETTGAREFDGGDKEGDNVHDAL